MASLLRSEARTLARDIAQDDGSNTACTDAQVDSYLEEARQWYASIYPEDVYARAGIVIGVESETTLTTTETYRSLDFAFDFTSGDPMDKGEFVQLIAKQKDDALNAVPAGIMRTWACIRLTDTTWRIAVYPTQALGNTRQLHIYGHYEVEPLGSDSDNVLFGEHGSRVIARLAALEVARAAGRPAEFITNIASQLPERILTRRADLARMVGVQPART